MDKLGRTQNQDSSNTSFVDREPPRFVPSWWMAHSRMSTLKQKSRNTKDLILP